MREIRIKPEFKSWQQAARRLVQQGVPPEEVVWLVGDSDPPLLPGLWEPDHASDLGQTTGLLTVPRRFMAAAQRAASHPNHERWALLYRILWRITHENRQLLENDSDPDVKQLLQMERQAGRDAEGSQDLQMATPRTEPARSALPFVPLKADLATLRAAAPSCTGCELYKNATQVVFGQGPSNARVVFVGEQPGDQEDLQGAPFVGPAGEVLDRALGEAGIARSEVYVTNVVKHFKWEARGRRRIHQTPRQAEIEACRPWLEAELHTLRPEVIVCLGSTALQALMGTMFRVLKSRGQVFKTPWAPALIATLHPSAVLRADDPAAAAVSYRMLLEDLRAVAARLREKRVAGLAPPVE